MSAASAEDFDRVVSRVHLVGTSSGLVKKLAAFDRSRHVVPDAVNPATSGFLARLIQGELAAEAEDWYQRTRAALQYKRKDLALEVAAPTAILTAKDFVFELSYGLNAENPEEFILTRTLHQVTRPGLVALPEFDALFRGQFGEVSFILRRSVRVEAVIDAVEGLEGAGLLVDYPSDYRFCLLRVEGVPAEVRCDGASVSMTFPRAASPAELLEAFREVRRAFSLSKQSALSGLIG